MRVVCWIEWGLAVLMLVGPLYVLYGRFHSQPTMGVGARMIQLVALLLLVPLIGILALEGKLGGDTTSGLLGVAIGYTLSGVEKAVPSNPSSTSNRGSEA